jgi:predicted enzyme related to lactoylglutathione lyase
MANKKPVTVGWFEIPAADMERAIKFYETVFDCKLDRNKMGDFDMAWFPWDDEMKGAGGSLVHHEMYTPSQKGTLVYFSSEDINTELNRVKKAGGKVIRGKTEISPEIGYMAYFTDTEGNRIALHSRK